MSDEQFQEMLERITQKIRERFDPERIILFGSQARGNAGAESDLDLLVVMPISGSRRRAAAEIGLALRDIPLPKDIIVSTPEDYDWRKDVAGTIEYPASREGRVLYAKH